MIKGWRYHIVGGEYATGKMMADAGGVHTGLRQAEIVVFTGGTDISPTLYGEGFCTETQMPDAERDAVEQGVYHASVAKKKLIVGICRGAQLVNVLNGGKLWQHIDNHTNCTHTVRYLDQRKEVYDIPVSSDHHQLMRPTADANIWAWSGLTTKRENYNQVEHMRTNHTDDPEIVFYRATRSLCFQAHPEWGLSTCRNLFFDCVKRASMV